MDRARSFPLAETRVPLDKSAGRSNVRSCEVGTLLARPMRKSRHPAGFWFSGLRFSANHTPTIRRELLIIPTIDAKANPRVLGRPREAGIKRSLAKPR